MNKKFFIIVLIVLAVTALSLANTEVLCIAASALQAENEASEPSQQLNTTQS